MVGLLVAKDVGLGQRPFLGRGPNYAHSPGQDFKELTGKKSSKALCFHGRASEKIAVELWKSNSTELKRTR